MTVREVIDKLQSVESIQKLSPRETCDYQVYLAAMYWEVGNEVIQTEQNYSRVWKSLRDTVESDKHCEKTAMLSPEWIKYRQAIYLERTMLECIRSLKRKMQQFENEARNQY